MFKKIVINICVLLVLFFMLMFDKYMFNLNIFGINITIYYLIILFVGTYLDTPNGIIILSIITLIQEMTIGTNIGMITISTIISFLILKKVNKILYEENVINITLILNFNNHYLLHIIYVYIYIWKVYYILK